MSKEKVKQYITYLNNFVFSEKKDLVLVVIYCVLISAFSLIVPITTQALVNSVAFISILQPIIVLTVIVFFFLFTSGILKIFQLYIIEVLQQRTFVKCALLISDLIPKFKAKEIKTLREHELVRRFYEITPIQKASAILLLDGVTVCVQVLVGMLLMSFYHPFLFVFVFFILIYMYFIFVYSFKSGVKSAVAESDSKYNVLDWLEEQVYRVGSLRNQAGINYSFKKTDDLLVSYILSRKKHFRVLLGHYGGAFLAQTIFSSVLLIIGSVLVMKNQLTLGQLVASELILASILSGIAKLGKFLESYYDLTSSVGKLTAVFDLQQSQLNSENADLLLNNITSIKAENLSTEESIRLNDVSLNLNSDEKIVILSDEKKFLKNFYEIISGSRDVSSGRVLINDNDIKNINFKELLKNFLYVGETPFFNGSILDNLTYGNSEIKLEEVKDILTKLSLWDPIQDLEFGLNENIFSSKIINKSLNVLKLGIARALLLKPKVLFIEIDCSLGLRNEMNDLFKLLFEVLNKTIIFIQIKGSPKDFSELNYAKFFEFKNGVLDLGVKK